jgi:hypothetical protein
VWLSYCWLRHGAVVLRQALLFGAAFGSMLGSQSKHAPGSRYGSCRGSSLLLAFAAAAGPGGVAAILARCPEIMLCKPTTNDRWDRRAVELSAYLLRNGHCNVPEVGEGLWGGIKSGAQTFDAQLDTGLCILGVCGTDRDHASPWGSVKQL